MQRLCGTTRGCDIRIVKRVPIGAGMAGGSADAAGAMTALHRLWGFDIHLESVQGEQVVRTRHMPLKPSLESEQPRLDLIVPPI